MITRSGLASPDLDALLGEIDRQGGVTNQLTGLNIANVGTVVFGYNDAGTGAFTYDAPGPILMGQVQHGLGYVPLAAVWMRTGSSPNYQYIPLPYINLYTGAGPNGKVSNSIRTITDSQYLNFYLDFGFATSVAAPVFGFVFHYYIFRDPLSN